MKEVSHQEGKKGEKMEEQVPPWEVS